MKAVSDSVVVKLNRLLVSEEFGRLRRSLTLKRANYLQAPIYIKLRLLVLTSLFFCLAQWLSAESVEQFVLVQPGTFIMGDTVDSHRVDRFAKFHNLHRVTLTRPFYLSSQKVTVAQFAKTVNWAIENRMVTVESKAVSLQEGSVGAAHTILFAADRRISLAFFASFQWSPNKVDLGWDRNALYVLPERGDFPMVNMTWLGSLFFCNIRSLMEGLSPYYDFQFGNGYIVTVHTVQTSNGYRLPTEAEWEFAARGGTLSQGFRYPGSNDYTDIGHFLEPGVLPLGTYSIRQYKPNELGLFDMGADVREWVWGLFLPYPDSSVIDPSDGEYKLSVNDDDLVYKDSEGPTPVARGASWNFPPKGTLWARTGEVGSYNGFSKDIGLRLAKNIPH
jgi:formylglycine-generating enzyme required for sulfatase activity